MERVIGFEPTTSCLAIVTGQVKPYLSVALSMHKETLS
jgi:hypothetical protein